MPETSVFKESGDNSMRIQNHTPSCLGYRCHFAFQHHVISRAKPYCSRHFVVRLNGKILCSRKKRNKTLTIEINLFIENLENG